MGWCSDFVARLEADMPGACLNQGIYGYPAQSFAQVKTFVALNTGDAHETYWDVNITYVKALEDATEESMKLRLFNGTGAEAWTYAMKQKVWDGAFPICVAINLDTRGVYFLHLGTHGLMLEFFTQLSDTAFEELEDNLILDSKPYKINLTPESMFAYIDGAEGLNHLKQNVVIEFNCGYPLNVSLGAEKETNDMYC